MGFSFVEYPFPYEHSPETLRGLLERHGLRQVLFNLSAGDWGAGDRGLGSDPKRVEEFRRSVDEATGYAKALGVDRVNCLVGLRIDGVSFEEQWRVLVENLRYASEKFARQGLDLLAEPINAYDIPGFFISSTREALRLLDEVRADNLKIQYDVYHMQKMEGNLVETIREHLARIGHIQIADNPGRHQPGTGEINYRFLLNELDRMGYEGYVGLEYVPEPDTKASLSWVEELGFSL
jgi:hydroxypyruvate isomerase